MLLAFHARCLPRKVGSDISDEQSGLNCLGHEEFLVLIDADVAPFVPRCF